MLLVCTAAATVLTLGFVLLLHHWVLTQNPLFLVSATICNLLAEPVMAKTFTLRSPSMSYSIVNLASILGLALIDFYKGRLLITARTLRIIFFFL